MTLKFLSIERMPNFIAESSDISEGKIAGCSIVGATVFMSDTYEWYIVKNDLSLENYGLPISVAGDITIGLVNQGSAGMESWPVILDSEIGRLFISSTKKSITVNDEAHYRVHDGTLWSASYLNTAVSAGATIALGCSTGANRVHVNINHACMGEGKVEFYGGCTFTDGTPLTIVNHDLAISASAGTPDIGFYVSPTINVAGSIFRSLLIPGGGQGANKSGGLSPFSVEYIIPENTQMYMKYTNLDGNDGAWNATIDFYEE